MEPVPRDSPDRSTAGRHGRGGGRHTTQRLFRRSLSGDSQSSAGHGVAVAAVVAPSDAALGWRRQRRPQGQDGQARDGAFVDVEATNFEATLKPFEDATGVDVLYNGNKSVRAADQCPGPGGQSARRGAYPAAGRDQEVRGRRARSSRCRRTSTRSSTPTTAPAGRRSGTAADGKVYGIFHRVNFKAQVFYPKVRLRGQGLHRSHDVGRAEGPQGQDGRGRHAAVVHRHREGAATGWPATDWVEAIMLRTVGTDGYDKWVSHAMPFTDAAVKNAFQIVNDIFEQQEATCTAARSTSSRPSSATSAQGPVRRAAQVLADEPGQLRDRVLHRRGQGGPRRRRSASSPCRPSTRVRHARRWSVVTDRRVPRSARGLGPAQVPDHSRGRVCPGPRPVAPSSRTRTRTWPTTRAKLYQSVRQGAGRGPVRALRRLGPDAAGRRQQDLLGRDSVKLINGARTSTPPSRTIDGQLAQVADRTRVAAELASAPPLDPGITRSSWSEWRSAGMERA